MPSNPSAPEQTKRSTGSHTSLASFAFVPRIGAENYCWKNPSLPCKKPLPFPAAVYRFIHESIEIIYGNLHDF